jgi:cardiolipin synthase
MPDFIPWELIVVVVHLALAAAVSIHVILTKYDVRSAIGWTGLAWLAPVMGSVLYVFFGINRIRRAADQRRLIRDLHTTEMRALATAPSGVVLTAGELPTVSDELTGLALMTGRVSEEPLVSGNSIAMLENGDEAYPAMLAAIRSARATISLATYIFDRGFVGDQFLEVLADAVKRGVKVRVLIDGVGSRYSRPPMIRELKRRGVPVALFLPPMLPLPQPYLNLRNHRKILVVDGTIGFTGGMNIRDECLLSRPNEIPTRDTHFRLEGPIVRQLQETFVFDWRFTTGELLDGDVWFGRVESVGDMTARGISDGPDELTDALLLTLLGALAQSRERVRIVTPYFLPDAPLVEALRVTAMRGVEVTIVLPEKGNLRLVQWAQEAKLYRILAGGCRILRSPAPFDHSKLMTVDGGWALFGSANWDPRSLRLNFEKMVECYSPEFTASVDRLIDARIAESRDVTMQELREQPLPIRIRNGIAWLAQPYL